VDLPAVCKAHSEMRSMSLLGGVWGMAPRKMHALRLNQIFSEAQNCYAKDRLLKSAVREFSLAVHILFLYFLLSIWGVKSPLGLSSVF